MHARLVPLVAARPTRPTEGGIESTVKIALGIPHGTKGVFVIIIGEPPTGVDGLIQVRFAVLVGVHQTRQFRALHHIDVAFLLVNPQAQTFVQTIGV